jgi:hypothetical protein
VPGEKLHNGEWFTNALGNIPFGLVYWASHHFSSLLITFHHFSSLAPASCHPSISSLHMAQTDLASHHEENAEVLASVAMQHLNV